jgi:hypothetical protein
MTLRRRRAQAYPLSTFRFPAIRDRNLSQVADDAALPLLCQAKNLSLAQLFRMLESGARFGERLRQLTRSQRRDCVTIDGQTEKAVASGIDAIRAQTGVRI